ncbi:MAG: gliding motility-associated C-terminal domain-containing protein [Elusimicrobia bacterium]|nr:gliding motility-associated C-terminal domain-containing protein [Elusimicrobiota bacterium]
MLLAKSAAALLLALALQASSALLAQNVTFNNPKNRFITPNGDGKNDNVVFDFSNPSYSEVEGKIYDVRGRFVADTSPAISTGLDGRLTWDGKSSGGQIVATGLYIYVLKTEGQIFQGAVMVIR